FFRPQRKKAFLNLPMGRLHRFSNTLKQKAATPIRFLASILKTARSWLKNILKKRQSHTSAKYWQYEDITLKLFLDIASGGNLVQLCYEGKPTEDGLNEAWEELIKKNQRANGSNKFDNHFNSLQSYALMLNEYVLIKSALIKLAGEYALQKEPDLETIELLKQKGYKIDLKKYQESLEAGFKKAENLVTKVISKKNEIE